MGLEADRSQTSGLYSAFSYMGSSQMPFLDPGSMSQSHREPPVFTAFGNVDIGEISHDIMANMEPFDVNELDQYLPSNEHLQASGGASARSSALPYAYGISRSLVATSGPSTARLAQQHLPPLQHLGSDSGKTQIKSETHFSSDTVTGSHITYKPLSLPHYSSVFPSPASHLQFTEYAEDQASDPYYASQTSGLYSTFSHMDPLQRPL